MKYIHTYTTDVYPDKMIVLTEDEVGWLYIARLPYDGDNIFPSLEFIEQYLNLKLIHRETMECA